MSTVLRIRRAASIIECPCYQFNPQGAESPVLTVQVGAGSAYRRWVATCLPTDARATRARMMTGAGIRALASRRTLPAAVEMQAYDFACDGYMKRPWGKSLCDGAWHAAAFSENTHGYELTYDGERWLGEEHFGVETYRWYHEFDLAWQGEAGPWLVTVYSRISWMEFGWWSGSAWRRARLGRTDGDNPLSAAGTYDTLVAVEGPYGWRAPTPTDIEQAGYVIVQDA